MATNFSPTSPACFRCALALCAVLLPKPAVATPFDVLFERDPDQIVLGDDIFYTTYDSFQDLIDNNASSFGLTDIGLGTPTSLSVRGVTAVFDPTARPVPVPATGWLFLISLAGLGLCSWQRRRATA